MLFSRRRNPAVIVFLALFAAQSGFMVLTPVLPDVARDLGVSTGTAGELRIACGLAGGAVALALAAGWSPLGLRDLIVAGLLLIVLGSVVAALAPTFAVLGAAQLLIGAGNAVLLSGGVAAAARWSEAGERARVLSWALLGPPGSWIVGMPLVGVIGNSSWRLALAFPLVASVVALAAVAARPADPPDAAPGGIWALLGRDRAVAGWAAGELFANAGWNGALTFAGALLLESYGASTALVGAALAAAAAAYIPGALLARRRAAQRPRVALAVLGGGMAVLVAAFGAVRPGLWPSVVLLATIVLLGSARTFAGSLAGLEARSGAEVTLMSIRGAATQLGIVVGALLGGTALAAGGYGLLGAVLSGMLIAGAVPHLPTPRGVPLPAPGRLASFRSRRRMRRHSAPTFVFADLADYTALTERCGDEAAARVAGDFQRMMRTISREHGARQVKSMGDGVMIWAPDAGAAIALAARAVTEVGARPDLLPVRVGVNTGTAVMRGYDWYGSAVNVAARLARESAPNEALVSASTRAAALGRLPHRLTARRDLSLHGLDRRVAAWRLAVAR